MTNKEKYLCPNCYAVREFRTDGRFAYCSKCKGTYYKKDLVLKVEL